MSIHQKTPIARTLPQFVERRINSALDQLGTGLPGRVVSVGNSLVTIAFNIKGLNLPQVRMPWESSEYTRLPIQAGDLGVAVPVSKYYVGGVSGLGTGTGGTTQQGNLSSLVWKPTTNKNWSGVDANALTLYGPNGVVLRDSASKSVDTITPTNRTTNVTDGNWTVDVSDGNMSITASGTLTLQVGSHAIIINSSGISIDGVPFLPHTHTGGTISGDTGPVIP
jgi:hypothetical protein